MESNLILEHCRQPYHQGMDPGATHKQRLCHSKCGDEVTISVRMRGFLVDEAWFIASGCMVSRAAASVLCEHIESKTVEDLIELDQEFFLSQFGVELTPYRKLCALLPLEVLKLILRTLNETPSD